MFWGVGDSGIDQDHEILSLSYNNFYSVTVFELRADCNITSEYRFFFFLQKNVRNFSTYWLGMKLTIGLAAR